MSAGHTATDPKTQAPEVHDPALIRNVVMVGGSGSGKTTITEALLLNTGTITRAGSVEEGTTVTDHDDAAKRTHRSVGLSIAPIVRDGIKINLVDAPGYADYLGDLRAALRAADSALFVVSAVDGISGATRALWDECAAVKMPRAVLLTKLDNPQADFDAVVADCRQAFGAGVLPLVLPLYGQKDVVTGLMTLLTGQVVDRSTGERVVREPVGDEVGKLERNREALIEAIIAESDDDLLLDSYLEGGELDGERLLKDLEIAVAKASFFPILAMAAPGGVGTNALLNLIVQGFPPPTDAWVPEATTIDSAEDIVELTCDPAGPLLAEVIKTTADAYVGRVSLVRVFSGTLQPDSTVHCAGRGVREGQDELHESNERVGALSSPLGRFLRPVDQVLAGDICAVAKLANAETGDTLSDPQRPLLVEPWSPPEALLPLAIKAKTAADEDKLATALARLVAEDPTLRWEQNPLTGQLVLWCLGQAHADVAFERLKDKYGVEIDQVPYRVGLQETFTQKATAKGRHVKQSGGHGQYAVCDIEVEPLPAGTGFEFVDKVVGGAVPRQFIPSVEKGVRQQMAKGVAAGYPMTDIRVTLVDGKAHSVDSSDMAFQMAGALALREAAQTAGVTFLEPMMDVMILVDDENVGTVMSDLATRRGRVTGTEAKDSGRTIIRADVPEIEVTNYAIDLRSMSRGSGTFTRSFIGFEPMPSYIADKIIAEQED